MPAWSLIGTFPNAARSVPRVPVDPPRRETIVSWKKVVLLLFVIGALAAVVVVYMTIQGALGRIA